MPTVDYLFDSARQGNTAAIETFLREHPEWAGLPDSEGATALHYAALAGHADAARMLIRHGADVNARDTCFNATPAGWAIEYLRELGGLLGIELDDFGFAIARGDVAWVSRFLHRFPALREACNAQGIPFRTLAEQSVNPELLRLFDPSTE